MRKLTTDIFIKQAKEVHGDKYDYSKVEYINNYTKVCIICPIHGEFWQTPKDHLNCSGCPVCSSKKLTTDIFIKKAKEVHGDKYDYSKVKYVDAKTKVCIICPIHGEFWQTPNNHLSGKGCKKCADESKTKRTQAFITQAKAIHGDKYDYSKVEYKNRRTKICIICPIHGEFWQRPFDHLKGSGCPVCSDNKLTTDIFIKKAKEVHGDKYDYSKVKYVDTKTKVCIICPIHGEFWQTPTNHLSGNGCKKCADESKTKRTQAFITQAKAIHGDKYDYSKVKYVDAKTKVCIICPIHGEFWQTPTNHLSGKGCPVCKQSKLEQEIQNLLIDNKIIFDYNKFYKEINNLQLDFYIPSKNVAIECQGLQHFEPVDHFGGMNNFKKRVRHDKQKQALCEANGIKLLYYSNLGIEYPYKVYENKEEILKEILSA